MSINFINITLTYISFIHITCVHDIHHAHTRSYTRVVIAVVMQQLLHRGC
jgi:hypothetical protein